MTSRCSFIVAKNEKPIRIWSLWPLIWAWSWSLTGTVCDDLNVLQAQERLGRVHLSSRWESSMARGTLTKTVQNSHRSCIRISSLEYRYSLRPWKPWRYPTPIHGTKWVVYTCSYVSYHLIVCFLLVISRIILVLYYKSIWRRSRRFLRSTRKLLRVSGLIVVSHRALRIETSSRFQILPNSKFSSSSYMLC